VCKYLRDFNERMEGTPEGMSMAIPQPQCERDGKYKSLQCSANDTTCDCVNDHGVVLKTGLESNSTVECQAIREQTQSCKHFHCSLNCPYGYEVDEAGCERCQCHKPCQNIICQANEVCTMIHVNCTSNEYCPAVPACLTIKPGQCPYLIPQSSDCTLQCRNDYECSFNEKCCSNGCGTQCVIPMRATACQHSRAIAEHLARESGEPARRIYIPTCEPNGTFKEIQCHNAMCWCVDQEGTEISGTRSPVSSGPPYCKLPRICPEMPKNCHLNCPNGFELDIDTGCPICFCRDLCKQVTCRGENEACRMVEVACSSSPCPPLPICLPKKENPCPIGSPLLQQDGSLVTCGPSGHHCPSTHKCELSPLDEYALCCPKPREVCLEPSRNVSCDLRGLNATERWYFDPERNECRNKHECTIGHNDFSSELVCNTVCPILSVCEQLREKNLKRSQQLKKPTFLPRCDTMNGIWQPIQCLEHVGICWCSSSEGVPLKNTFVKNAEPVCSFRQARRVGIVPDDIDFDILAMMEENSDGLELFRIRSGLLISTKCQILRARGNKSVKCDELGRFDPTQCINGICFCIDDAGNRVVGSKEFYEGTDICCE